MSKETMTQALEAYMAAGFGNSTNFALQGKAYDLAVEALAKQPAQQEPVASVIKLGHICQWQAERMHLLPDGKHQIYTTPQAQPAPEIAIADAYRAGVDSGISAEREACAKVVEDFARKWWKIHCDSNKHLESTLKAHQDFCALQAAIRARGKT